MSKLLAKVGKQERAGRLRAEARVERVADIADHLINFVEKSVIPSLPEGSNHRQDVSTMIEAVKNNLAAIMAEHKS
ncbi:hypothetical protein CL653_03260 [bacterium]|nr:hypothetical protein [bacterium]|tara:strand:+ start:3314 stop:3541 length:228 start_codon:yes stop_codon:yes gene_type:complete